MIIISKLFGRWNKSSIEEKADILLGLNIFCLFLILSLGFYSLALTFQSFVMFLFAIIMFFIGIYVVWRFLKRAGKFEKGGGVPAFSFKKKKEVFEGEDAVEIKGFETY